jgi:hypothetical protein
MQNGPHVFKVDHRGFCVFSKLFTQTFLIGRGDVTFLHVTYTKPSQNVEKLTCVHGRFKSPFFLWLIQILKAVTTITFFWSSMANPAIKRIALDLFLQGVLGSAVASCDLTLAHVNKRF